MDLLKQFSKEDLMGVLRGMVGLQPDTLFAKKMLDELHGKKFNRLVALHNKKVDEYDKKFGKYKGKSVPKHLLKDFNKFMLSFQKVDMETKAQEKIMVERKMIKKGTE